jgi:hypothetical protein
MIYLLLYLLGAYWLTSTYTLAVYTVITKYLSTALPPGIVVHAQPFQNKIAATKPFHGDTLLGDDQHRQNEKDDTFRVGIRFCQMFTISSSWVLPPPIEGSGTSLIVRRAPDGKSTLLCLRGKRVGGH